MWKTYRILFVLLVFTAFSCRNTSTELVQDFDWLTGSWIRTNDAEDQITYEKWEKLSESEYLGFGCTVQNNDTIWMEHIQLIREKENWSFNVTGEGETEATKFLVSSVGKASFVCKNEANEFPKEIEYSKVGKKLNATISGNDMVIHFDFEKLADTSEIW